MRFGKGGGWQGAMDETRPDRPVFPYQRAFQCVVAACSDVEAFLSIGVGTGTALHAVLKSHPNASIYGVEIDETVLNVAMSYFNAPDYKRVDYWVGDGFSFVRNNAHLNYNLVFVDAYMRNAINQSAATVDTMNLLASQLRPDGAIVYNLIAPSLHTVFDSRGDLIQAAKRRFESVIDFPVGIPYTEQNRLLVITRDTTFMQRLRHAITHSPYLSIFERVVWSLRVNQV